MDSRRFVFSWSISAFVVAVVLFCLCLSAVPRLAHAQAVYTEGPLYYIVEDGSVSITGYFGRNTEVEIPSSIAGMPVNTIAAGAFVGTAALTVVIPDCVTTMEAGAVSPGTDVVWADSISVEGGSSAASRGIDDSCVLEEEENGTADAQESDELGEFEATEEYDGVDYAGETKAAQEPEALNSEKVDSLAAGSVVGAEGSIIAIAIASSLLLALIFFCLVLVVKKLRSTV